MESLESWKASASRQSKLTGLVENAASDSASDGAFDAQMSRMSGRNRVFLLSAKDDSTARSMVTNLKKYLVLSKGSDEEDLLDSLAYTLSERRSRFPWSVAVAARTLRELTLLLEDPKLKPSRASEQLRLGFVFTGQGAQWYGMGRELITAYPVFEESLRQCDQYLKELGATWSLLGA